jgi:hypothetical protein
MSTSFRVAYPGRIAAVLLVAGALFAGVACSAAVSGNASSAAPAAPGAEASAPPPATDDGEVAQLTANLRAAITNHDMRRYREFRNTLVAKVGAEAIQAADAVYRQALANLVAARAAHDAKATAEFGSQLRRLCSPTNLTSAIEFCEADLAALGG